MVQFFKDSFYMWVVTRLIMCIIIFLALVQQLSYKQWDAKLSALACIIYLITMLIILFQEFGSVKKNAILTKISGSFSFLLGACAGLLFLFVSSTNILLAFPLCVVAILLGLFDFYNIQSPNHRYDEE